MHMKKRGLEGHQYQRSSCQLSKAAAPAHEARSAILETSRLSGVEVHLEAVGFYSVDELDNLVQPLTWS